jgi:nicotinate-nucleotide adenylyltransferase
MKICIFGGTFDPPHLGHLLIAQTICEAEEFDKIIFVPALKNPLKSKEIASSIENRLKMLEIAVEGNPHFDISDNEIKRGGYSYSIDTIRYIKKEHNLKRDELYFLIGSDILKSFHNWREPSKILEECQVIVALRPGFKPSSVPNWILSAIQFANIPRFELSATQIRKRWKEDKTIRYMVTQPVWEFINKNSLYQ